MKCIVCGEETIDEELFCEKCRDKNGDNFYVPFTDNEKDENE